MLILVCLRDFFQELNCFFLHSVFCGCMFIDWITGSNLF